MKLLIVYFTFSGNNEVLAKEMARDFEADLAQITEPKKRGIFRIMLDILFNRYPKINELDIEWTRYDHFILMAPVWNFQIAHPMKSFIRKNGSNLKNYTFITLCTGREKQQEKIEVQLLRLAVFQPRTIISFEIRHLPNYQVNTNSQYEVTERDLKWFKQRKTYLEMGDTFKKEQ